MDKITYKGQTITPIMKPMLVWDDNESIAIERFIYVKNEPSIYPWKGADGDQAGWWGWGNWKNAKPIPEHKEISMQEIADKFGINVKKLRIKKQ